MLYANLLKDVTVNHYELNFYAKPFLIFLIFDEK